MSKTGNFRKKIIHRAKLNAEAPLISTFGNAGAVFGEQSKDEILHPQVIKMARKSGQLNLSNRGMIAIPQKVFHLNEIDENEKKNISLSMKMDDEDDKWWQQMELTKLYLNSNSLNCIDPIINKLEALQFLDISDNRLTTLPNSIGELKCLNQLNLSHNDLHTLPQTICQLENLRALVLDHNNLKTLPDDLGSLYVLENLDVSHNSIESLPSSIGYLQRLSKLNLSDNQLTSIPPEIGDSFGLIHLDVSRNILKVLPSSMSNLPKLQELYLRQNLLTKLPHLKSPPLKELHVGVNKIKCLDLESLENLIELRVLDISENGIEDLPNEITLLQYLQRLDLTNNYLSNLPLHIGLLPHLTALHLNGNPLRLIRSDIIQRGTSQLLKYLASKITDPVSNYPGFANYVPESPLEQEKNIPDQYEMRNMKAMIYNQKAKEIPDALFTNGQLAKVRTADLSDNLLISIPEKLSELSGHLYELILHHNRLTLLPQFLGLFKNLQFINIQNNQLTSLPLELANLTELREINMTFNRFECFPPVLYKISSLEILFAGENKIINIEAEEMLKMDRLTVLDLHNNNIDFVPPLLGKMTQLKTLHLEGNAFRVPRFDVLAKGCDHVLEYLRSRIVE